MQTKNISSNEIEVTINGSVYGYVTGENGSWYVQGFSLSGYMESGPFATAAEAIAQYEVFA